MVKHTTSPAFGLNPNLPLGQLPHVNSASATVSAKRKPSCLTCLTARDAHSSPGDLTTAGRRTQPLPLKPARRPALGGMRVNDVSAVTCGLAFAEIGLGGGLQVLFLRVKDGAPRRGDGLGRGVVFRLRRPRPHRKRLGYAPDGLPPRLTPRRSTSTPRAARRRARRTPPVQSHERRHRQRAGRGRRRHLLLRLQFDRSRRPAAHGHRGPRVGDDRR
jgi:hypothetical protein